MTTDTVERELLGHVVSELEAEGFEVFVRPDRRLLPSSLIGITPDAVAFRGDKKLVVEIERQSSGASERLARISACLDRLPDWELRVFVLPSRPEQRPFEAHAAGDIRSRIAEVRELGQSQHRGPAMLLAWSAIEAVARSLLRDRMGRPQTPGRLIQELASDGYLTPTEADRLRTLIEKRNRLAHGDLRVCVTSQEIDEMSAILDTLVGQIAA